MKFVKIPFITRRNTRISDKAGSIESLLSTKKDSNADGKYESKKMLMFNETSYLRKMLTRMINVCEELKDRQRIMTDTNTPKTK